MSRATARCLVYPNLPRKRAEQATLATLMVLFDARISASYILGFSTAKPGMQ